VSHEATWPPCLTARNGGRFEQIRFGRTLGAGAFGTVKEARVQLDGEEQSVAVKTLIFTSRDDFEEKLDEFKTEASIGWEVSACHRQQVSAQGCASQLLCCGLRR
jgi:hypothetical protein